ncbi:MAG: hypothetical protein R8F63_01600 [Acidimicrobiales bacterium]|nr:hypothetical protein [Acidimicrobiales bacterium]
MSPSTHEVEVWSRPWDLPRVPRQKVTDALTALVWADPALCPATVDG